MLSTAKQFGSVLDIIASPGSIVPRPFRPEVIVRHIVLEADAKDHAKLDVTDSGTLLGQFTISSIKTVNVNVAGLDAIDLDDSNGLPLAAGTGVNLFGTGIFGNSLNLIGSQPVNPGGGEGFTQQFDAEHATLSDGGVQFQFHNGINAVTDEWTNTSPSATMFVKTFSQKVTLSGQDGLTETFSGLTNFGSGPGTLTFAGKGRSAWNSMGPRTSNRTPCRSSPRTPRRRPGACTASTSSCSGRAKTWTSTRPRAPWPRTSSGSGPWMR